MTKVTESARNEDCAVRLPGCSFDPATTVFAHIGGVRFGHGMGIKTKLGAYACAKCHDLIDSRVKRPDGMTIQDVKTLKLGKRLSKLKDRQLQIIRLMIISLMILMTTCRFRSHHESHWH